MSGRVACRLSRVCTSCAVSARTDSDREYLAFTSRFAMRSVWRVPAFIGASFGIMKQIEATPGAVGYSLGSHLPGLYFYTLSAWEDDESLREVSRTMQHGRALRTFHGDMRAVSPFIRWRVRGSELPLRWDDALARMQTWDAQSGVATAT